MAQHNSEEGPVSDDLNEALNRLTGLDNQGRRNQAAAESGGGARSGYQFCTWFGRCYYCWDGYRWHHIFCLSP